MCFTPWKGAFLYVCKYWIPESLRTELYMVHLCEILMRQVPNLCVTQWKSYQCREIGSGTSNILVEMLEVTFEVCSLSKQVRIWASSLAAITYILSWIFLDSCTTESILVDQVL